MEYSMAVVETSITSTEASKGATKASTEAIEVSMQTSMNLDEKNNSAGDRANFIDCSTILGQSIVFGAIVTNRIPNRESNNTCAVFMRDLTTLLIA